MTGQEKIVRCYTVRVRQAVDLYQVTYAPRGQTTSHDNGSGEAGLAFEVKIHDEGDAIQLLRFHMRPDPDVTQADYEADGFAGSGSCTNGSVASHPWSGQLRRGPRNSAGADPEG